MTEERPPEQQESPAQAPWGARLRQLREERGITLREVAAELHLDLALLEALEAEDQARLPNAPFVKGYLRNYARLLEIPCDDLIRAYEQAHGEERPSLHAIGQVREISSRDAWPRYATWGVVAVVVLSVLGWWSSKILSEGVASRDDAETEMAAVPAPSAAEPGPDLEVEGESVSVEPLLAPATPAPTRESAPSAAPEAEAEARSSAPEAEPAPEPKPEVADETPALATVALDFKEDSWVEISDARGKRLFFDLGRKGQSRQVEGVPPFKILLGNAPGVELRIDGHRFDHDRYHRRNGSARFTLERNG